LPSYPHLQRPGQQHRNQLFLWFVHTATGSLLSRRAQIHLVLFVALVVALLAIVGKDHLSTIVSDFVSLLGYWTISFTLILLIEDQWFRKRSGEGYNLEVWDTPSKLPWGAAATFSLLAGYLAGGVPGMAQVWYVGPIARKFGPFGGDVGIYMSGAITLLCYTPLRYFERKKTGR